MTPAARALLECIVSFPGSRRDELREESGLCPVLYHEAKAELTRLGYIHDRHERIVALRPGWGSRIERQRMAHPWLSLAACWALERAGGLLPMAALAAPFADQTALANTLAYLRRIGVVYPGHGVYPTTAGIRAVTPARRCA